MTPNLSEWFRIIWTLFIGFIAYTIFIYNYIEKVKKEFKEDLSKKVDDKVYNIQYSTVLSSLEKLTDQLIKLEQKIDKMEDKWDKKLDNITRRINNTHPHNLTNYHNDEYHE